MALHSICIIYFRAMHFFGSGGLQLWEWKGIFIYKIISLLWFQYNIQVKLAFFNFMSIGALLKIVSWYKSPFVAAQWVSAYIFLIIISYNKYNKK